MGGKRKIASCLLHRLGEAYGSRCGPRGPYGPPFAIMRARSRKAAGREGRSGDREGLSSAPSLRRRRERKMEPMSMFCLC